MSSREGKISNTDQTVTGVVFVTKQNGYGKEREKAESSRTV
jgi:hypothetical protein